MVIIKVCAAAALEHSSVFLPNNLQLCQKYIYAGHITVLQIFTFDLNYNVRMLLHFI